MKIFHYNPNTLQFTGEDLADIDPLDNSNWLIPAYATAIIPPSPQTGKTRHFVDGVWVFQDIPSPPIPLVPTLPEVIGAKWNAIKAMRDQRKAGGVKVKVGAANKWFHSDDSSRIQQMGLVMMGASIPAHLQWKTMDGSFIAMNQTVAGAVFAAAAASDQAVFAVAEGHRVAMEASADPASYDYSTGWPKIYGE